MFYLCCWKGRTPQRTMWGTQNDVGKQVSRREMFSGSITEVVQISSDTLRLADAY